MTLSAADATLMRHPGPHKSTLTVNAVPLNIVATAQVNQASITYPLAQLTVDTTSANWLTEGLAGRMVMIGTAPGLYDVTVGVLRANVTATVIKFDQKYAGEPGTPRDIQQAIANDYYVSIVKYRPPWGLCSSIRKGVFYKFWETTYSDQGKNPRPIIRLGEHQQADCVSSVARFTIDVDPYYWTGRSYSSHQWGEDGQTEISASASQLVIDCAPGCHEITHSQTDNKGKQTIAYRYLFANDPDVFPPLSDTYPIRAATCTQEVEGVAFTLEFANPVPVDTFFPGQMFLITETASWNGDTVSDLDSVAHSYVCYLTEAGALFERSTSNGRTEKAYTTTLTLHSPVKMANSIPIEKQYIEEVKSPGNWTQVTSLLSNPVGVFYYLTAWHAPYLLDGHDFDFDTALIYLRHRAFDLNQTEALGGHLKQLSAQLNGPGVIGSRTNGTTKMRRHPCYMSNDDRNLLPTYWTWGAGDIRRSLEHGLHFRPQVGRTYAGGFATNGSSETVAYKAVAPGFSRSQAAGEATLEDTIVPFSGGLDRVLALSGYHHARQNPKTIPQPTLANRNLDVAQPVDVDGWHIFTINAGYDPLSTGWSAQRRICTRVTRTWTGPRTTRKEINHEWEVETFGYPGQQVPIVEGGAALWQNRGIPANFVPYSPKLPDLGVSVPLMTAWNSNYWLAYSIDVGQQFGHWNFMADETVDAAINTDSAYFSLSTDPLQEFVLTYNVAADTLYLYSVNDLFGAPTSLSLLYSWAGIRGSSALWFYNARVLYDPAYTDFVVVAWKNADGTYVQRSTDGGGTFNGSAVGYTTEPDTEFDYDALGIATYGGRAIVTARDGTQDADGHYLYFVYVADTPIDTWTKLTNPTDYSVLPSCLAMRSLTSALVPLLKRAAPDPADTLDVVDFDSGYSHYTVSGGGTSSGVASSGTYAGQANMAYGYESGSDSDEFVYCTVTVDLDAYYSFEQVSLWSNYLAGWTLNSRSSTLWVSLLDASGELIAQYATTDDSAFQTGTLTVTAAQLGLRGDEQIWQVRVQMRLDWTDGGDRDPGDQTFVFIDDIDMTATLVDYDTDRAIFSLNPATSTYTQRESFQSLPFWTYGIAIDGSNSDLITAIVRDEDGNQPVLLTSADGGVTWSRRRTAVGLIGAKRNNSVALLFGDNRLELSNDGGVTSYNQLGNWQTALGSPARIRGVAGVL